MAINKNHTFDDLDGIKCAIVETQVTPKRVAFLKSLLELNLFTVVVVPSPPAKTVAVVEGEIASPPPEETFTVGVTDVTFNATNAIFGRLLKTANGHIVTLAYWNQKEIVSHDEVPYFENT